ncbi:hypothetical protein Medea1_0055 [Pseudomonas phage Medea1]|uniref:Uncharacterized protein n=1 Tax=Pseudomonas phage Medea1 TaxID=2834256 RepID=A0A8E7KYD2_9CAUD|nr:hypothetical protein QIT78_gp55 [Pseudomonas phage Medea1]QVW29122.1 hypothetical protein Medea1_0055 [Pseudomonas phage Medea1]
MGFPKVRDYAVAYSDVNKIPRHEIVIYKTWRGQSDHSSDASAPGRFLYYFG